MVKKIETAELQALIKSVDYKAVSGTTLTLCVITLQSGFTLVGESACLNPADFNLELGKQYAYNDAFDQLWKLEGYARARDAYLAGEAE